MKKLVVSVLLLLSMLLSCTSCGVILMKGLSSRETDYEVSAENGYIVVNGKKTKYKVDEIEYTAGVTYAVSKGGTYAEVTGYTGTSTEVKIAERYNGLPVKSIAMSAFKNKTSITSIKIPSSVTSIGSSAFYGCTSLTSVTIPKSVTSIGDDTFYNCTSLTSVVIPDGVTSIGNYAFYHCTRLSSLVIPDSMTSIGVAAFQGCTNLTKVNYTGTSTEWKKIEIRVYNTDLTDATISYNYVHRS